MAGVALAPRRVVGGTTAAEAREAAKNLVQEIGTAPSAAPWFLPRRASASSAEPPRAAVAVAVETEMTVVAVVMTVTTVVAVTSVVAVAGTAHTIVATVVAVGIVLVIVVVAVTAITIDAVEHADL